MRCIGDVGRCSQGPRVLLAAFAILAEGTTTAGLAATLSRSAIEVGTIAAALVASNAPPSDEIFRGDFDPPPFNDTCESALSLSVGSPATNGTTNDATSNYDSGLEICTGYTQAGPDVAYSIALANAQTITVTLGNSDPRFDPSISLVGPGPASVCNGAPLICLVGADLQGFGGGESFIFTTSQPGTYYIIVDSYYGNVGGDFTIGVTSP